MNVNACMLHLMYVMCYSINDVCDIAIINNIFVP